MRFIIPNATALSCLNKNNKCYNQHSVPWFNTLNSPYIWTFCLLLTVLTDWTIRLPRTEKKELWDKILKRCKSVLKSILIRPHIFDDLLFKNLIYHYQIRRVTECHAKLWPNVRYANTQPPSWILEGIQKLGTERHFWTIYFRPD